MQKGQRHCDTLVPAYSASLMMQNCLLSIWLASIWKCGNLPLNLQNGKWEISFLQETVLFCSWTDNISSRIINMEYHLFLKAGELGEIRVKIKIARRLVLEHNSVKDQEEVTS